MRESFTALVLVLVNADVIGAMNVAPKAALRGLFQAPAADPVLADPVDKQPLRTEVTFVGGLRRERKVSSTGVTYPVNRVYADLLPTTGRRDDAPTIGLDELRNELADAWGSRVQTGLFRSPLTAFLYERVEPMPETRRAHAFTRPFRLIAVTCARRRLARELQERRVSGHRR